MKISSFISLVIVFALFSGYTFSQSKDHPGKQVFIDSKCTMCHSVKSEDLTAKTKNKNAPDLSNIGATYRANFIEKFLMKQEKIDGKEHPQPFKGSDQQLEQLAEWLESQKTGETSTDKIKGTKTEEMRETKTEEMRETKTEEMRETKTKTGEITLKDIAPGKQLFMDSKCTTCHSIKSEGLTAKTKNKNAPDLSNIGTTYRADFIEKFLKKQEKVDGKEHPQAFKGSDQQLQQLAEWLESQKSGETTTDKTKKSEETKEIKNKTGETKVLTDTTSGDKK